MRVIVLGQENIEVFHKGTVPRLVSVYSNKVSEFPCYSG